MLIIAWPCVKELVQRVPRQAKLVQRVPRQATTRGYEDNENGNLATRCNINCVVISSDLFRGLRGKKLLLLVHRKPRASDLFCALPIVTPLDSDRIPT